MRPVTALAAFAALAVPALGELAVTAPTASTTCSGGQRCTIAWSDNNSGVTLAQQGNATVALYTGGKSQQTFLQPIAFPEPINVATTASIEFTVDPTVGENGRFYFIRFSSVNLKDGVNPYLSFSAVFTLDNMTGTFNSTVKTQLQDVNTGASTPTSTGGASTSRATSQTSVATTTRSSTSATRSATSSASANSTGAGFVNASPVTYTGAAAFIGAVVGLFF